MNKGQFCSFPMVVFVRRFDCICIQVVFAICRQPSSLTCHEAVLLIIIPPIDELLSLGRDSHKTVIATLFPSQVPDLSLVKGCNIMGHNVCQALITNIPINFAKYYTIAGLYVICL